MTEENEKKEEAKEPLKLEQLAPEGRSMVIPNFSGLEMQLHAQYAKGFDEKPELVTQDESPAPPKDIVVVASNPQQMQTAQQNLIQHFTSKLDGLKSELKDAEENLASAKKNKWKRGPFERVVSKVQNNIEFYEKIKAALEAGYVIIPNLENLDIFAIRTTRKNPKANTSKGGSGWVQPPERQVSNKPALGEGRYVNADTINETWTQDITPAGATQRQTRLMSTAKHFDTIDFPFHLAKPQILNSTAEAMKVLAFDDIGVTPGRKIKRGDPMIVGRILHGSGYRQKVVSFLITWFVDTKDI